MLTSPPYIYNIYIYTLSYIKIGLAKIEPRKGAQGRARVRARSGRAWVRKGPRKARKDCRARVRAHAQHKKCPRKDARKGTRARIRAKVRARLANLDLDINYSIYIYIYICFFCWRATTYKVNVTWPLRNIHNKQEIAAIPYVINEVLKNEEVQPQGRAHRVT